MITIINYGMGNLGSITNMIKRVGFSSEITSDLLKIESASKIILPGVGHFDKAMQNIISLGLLDIIKKKALVDKTPILGICLGMQLMCKNSEEGNEKGIGLINAEVKKFKFSNNILYKVPHMGWNLINISKESPLLFGMNETPRFYFVHSYYVMCNDINDVLSTTSYGFDFHSSFAHNNIMGVQFHPEKSHKFGMQLLKNFINL
ncbi:MAG: imidazole glycerol phosphate synthase subunit HisH [Bacteroidales bacterium]|nr:imidazole glycerol phosphate synthase subunit HisH [Bacteroidales bacterium]